VERLVLNPLGERPLAQRILVIRLGALGDVVRTLPAVALLRDHYPESRIDWLVEERAAGVIESRGFVDSAVVFPRARIESLVRSRHAVEAAREFRRFARALRASGHDLVLDFHSIARSALLAVLSGAPQRIGFARPYAREGSDWLATHRVRLAHSCVSRFDRNEALVRALIGEDADATLEPLCVAGGARAAMRHALGQAGAPVVLHAGSSAVAAHKRWGLDGFSTLARDLVLAGERVLVASGPAPDEREQARAVVSASRGAAQLAPPTDTFEELAALMQAARAFVGADSGPLHVASLVGTPVVQLIGPTDPVENEPWRPTPWRRVSVELACRPCRRGCAAAACMRGIESGAVQRALLDLVGHRVARLRALPSGG